MTDPAIASEKVELPVADGSRMAAYTARPEEAGPHPGLLLFQEAFGVNHHIRSVCDRFAAEGYVVIAPEMFHRTAPPGFEGSYTDFPAMMPHYQAVTTQTAEMDIKAAHDWLRSHAKVRANQISSVGFCMGGRTAFLANAHVPLFSGQQRCASVARRRLVLRRRHHPRVARPCLAPARASFAHMGWTGQTHSARATESGDRRPERRAKGLCERRVFSSRPWVLLRRTRRL